MLGIVAVSGIRHGHTDRASLVRNPSTGHQNLSSASELPEGQLATDIATRISQGDRQAEGAFVARYRPRLLHTVARLTSDFALVEDITNEALLIAISNLRTNLISDPSRLGGYTYGIAKNLLRATKRKSQQELESDPQLIDLVASESPGHQEILEQIEITQMIRRVIETVEPTRYREILVRHYVHQQDKEAICEAMGLTSLHFNRVLHRAKQSFKKEMEASHG